MDLSHLTADEHDDIRERMTRILDDLRQVMVIARSPDISRIALQIHNQIWTELLPPLEQAYYA